MAKWVNAIPSGNKNKRRGKLLRVAAYRRVSTAFEEQMGSLEAQQQFYTSMIDMRPDWSNAGIFSDHATGLNTAERLGLNTMLRLCRSGKIDLILTKSFSRFGRNTLDMLKTIRELRRLNVDVYFERENVWLQQQKSICWQRRYQYAVRRVPENVRPARRPGNGWRAMALRLPPGTSKMKRPPQRS